MEKKKRSNLLKSLFHRKQKHLTAPNLGTKPKTKQSIFSKVYDFFFKDRASNKEKEYFFENLGLMLSSGIDILVALKILGLEIKSKAIKETTTTLEEDITNGVPIWKSIEKSKLLPANLLSIIRVGEESGRLPENLKIVIMQIQKDREFKSKLRSASLYPMFVFILMTVVGLGVAILILPRISTIYKSLKTDLPTITKILIGAGDFLGEYGAVAVPAFIIGLFLIFYFVFVFPKTKILGQRILFRTPIIKRIIVEIEISRLGFLLGTLLDTGFPVLDSLSLLEYSTGYDVYKKFYTYLKDKIEKGRSFQQAFEEYKNIEKLIPVYARQLIISAEKTGNLAKALINIGETYEKKNDESTKDLTVLLEPVLLIIVWIGVAFIALAVILPIYSLVGNITDLATQRNVEIEEDTAIIDQEPVSLPQDSTLPGTTSLPETQVVEPVTVVEVPPPAPAKKLQILDTETGTLNVRETIAGNIIAQVHPGEVFEYVESNSGWFKIILANGSQGWVSGQYIKVI